MSANLMPRLRASKVRSELINHSFFKNVVGDTGIGRDQVAVVLGQWWHPLHYFPTFLARTIAELDDLNQKSFVADILDEELGEGDPTMAHERIFVATMTKVGFAKEELTRAAPFAATLRLLEGYRRGSGARLTALGCAFATEVADLAMVGGIGKLVRRVTGAPRLDWVDIHISQEPNHVEKVSRTLGVSLADEEIDSIIAAAENHWHDWCGFFSAVEDAVSVEQVGP